MEGIIKKEILLNALDASRENLKLIKEKHSQTLKEHKKSIQNLKDAKLEIIKNELLLKERAEECYSQTLKKLRRTHGFLIKED